MKEFRCPKCNELLFEYDGKVMISMKCHGCNQLVGAMLDDYTPKVEVRYKKCSDYQENIEYHTDQWGNTRKIVHEMGQ